MIRIMLAGRDQTSLTALKTGLANKDVHIVRAVSGGIGLSMVAERNFDLVVTESERAFIGHQGRNNIHELFQFVFRLVVFAKVGNFL